MCGRTVNPGRPVIFGEVLVDHLPSGRAVLGGAPFNVAWHLKGFGLAPLLISRIGEDVTGEWILDTMRGWGMDTGAIQCDPHHSTGTVEVNLVEEEPSFKILSDQAYDHMDVSAAARALRGGAWSLLYHGTLAARTMLNRAVIEALRHLSRSPVFIDVNLREPWWDAEPVGQLLSGARWAKLNRAELRELSGTVMNDTPSLLAAGQELRRRYGFETLLVTGGDQGAWFFTPGGTGFASARPAERIVDTVGTGDAFSAVCIVGLTLGWSLHETISRATAFAAAICEIPGATSRDLRLYEMFREQWAA